MALPTRIPVKTGWRTSHFLRMQDETHSMQEDSARCFCHTSYWVGSIAPAAAWPAGVRHMHGAPLSASFPRPLLESALAVWKASVRQTGRISKLHEEVSRLLWSLGILHTNQHITADGLFCVDIALQDQQVTELLCAADSSRQYRLVRCGISSSAPTGASAGCCY